MRHRAKGNIRNGARGIALVLIALLVGCEDSAEDLDVDGADPQAGLSITDPRSGEGVESEVITVRGVGLRDPSATTVRVFTDRWYEQAGTLHHSDNNSWSYGPVYLSGQGVYNKHTIRMEVIHSDGTQEAAEVTRIVRQ